MRKPVVAGLAVLSLAAIACSNSAPGTAMTQETLDKAASVITAEDFKSRDAIMSDDSMQGRNTPSAGLDKTAEWVASVYESLGMRGGAPEGGFIQRYPLVKVQLDTKASGLTSSNGRRLAFGADILPFRSPVAGTVSGGLVLVSGLSADAQVDSAAVKGKILAVLLPASTSGGRRGRYALLGAVGRAGAAAVLVIDENDDAAWATSAQRAMRPGVSLPREEGGRANAPMLQLRAASLDGLLAGTGHSVAEMKAAGEGVHLQPVDGADLTLTTAVSTEDASAPNVVAVMEGGDPALKDQYVVFSGHMDHLGMTTPNAEGDSVYNGADDDASGTVGVMEVARAMAALPERPRRSLIFLTVSGEEKGLWGSSYYSSHPTVPIEQIVADLNIDMISRNSPDTIVAIGKEHSDLGATMNAENAAHPELHMTAIDDIWPEQNFYSRSDHYNFARKGVPILFFFAGTHPDYHGLDDEVDRIDADKASRVSKLVFYLGAEVANRDQKPQWNPESYKEIVEGTGSR